MMQASGFRRQASGSVQPCRLKSRSPKATEARSLSKLSGRARIHRHDQAHSRKPQKPSPAASPTRRASTRARCREATGAEVFLKFENHQFTASFKERGALNKLKRLRRREEAAGCRCGVGRQSRAGRGVSRRPARNSRRHRHARGTRRA